MTIRKLGLTLALVTMLGGTFAFAQKEEAKDAADSTGDAMKKTGKKMKRGSKKAANKTAEKTEDGANAVKDKMK